MLALIFASAACEDQARRPRPSILPNRPAGSCLSFHLKRKKHAHRDQEQEKGERCQSSGSESNHGILSFPSGRHFGAPNSNCNIPSSQTMAKSRIARVAFRAASEVAIVVLRLNLPFVGELGDIS